MPIKKANIEPKTYKQLINIKQIKIFIVIFIKINKAAKLYKFFKYINIIMQKNKNLC